MNAQPDDEPHAGHGLARDPFNAIAAPGVAESPGNFGCRVTLIVQRQTAAGAAVPAWQQMVEGLAVHIRPARLVNGIFDTRAAQPLMRGGGPGDYFRLEPGSRLLMARPV